MHPLVQDREIAADRIDVEKTEAGDARRGRAAEQRRRGRKGIAAADAGHE
jgi:hypothetical protein